ncbi:MAG: M28 family peptidase [Candidatus Eremiobacteraeota bacterium]|nr:M28 family peptidase [Candidatus Eremiobacteraeota bacterium]
MRMLREQLLRHIETLCHPRNPIRHAQEWEATQNYLVDQLNEMDRDVLFQDFSTDLAGPDDEPVIGRNVLGEATEEASLIIVAHYDTVDDSPGADDNLSAVSVALEVARRCPNVHVLFPDLEEFGLQGSRHFVSSGKWSKLPALVLESVGYWTDSPNSQSFPEVFPVAFPRHFEWLKERSFRGDFWALLHLPVDRALADTLGEELADSALSLVVPEALLQQEEGQALRDFGRSDHLAFWERGRSCLMLTDSANFRNPNYHLPSDTADTLNLDEMERLTERLVSWCSTLPLAVR